MSRVLVVAAHPDDEVLGLGGTIKKHSLKGDEISCIILGEGATSRVGNRDDGDVEVTSLLKSNTMKSAGIMGYKDVYFADFPDNRLDSIDLLDITKFIEKYISNIKPDIVYTHHYGDLNIDHRLAFEAVLISCRPVGEYPVKEIYCFETPSSTEWNFKYGENIFKPNVFIDVEDTIKFKLEAINCYETEIREYPHPRSVKALEVIAARWGTVVGKTYVEAFELIRKVD